MAEAFIISLCCSVSSRHPDKDEGIEQARRAVPQSIKSFKRIMYLNVQLELI